MKLPGETLLKGVQSLSLWVLLSFLLFVMPDSALGHSQGPPEKEKEVAAGQAVAPRLQNLGKHTHPVTTASSQAQRFFDQGLILTYGFNHREAARSFREAARLDPECAMCYWGQALVLGPNINAPMARGAEGKAYELVRKALELKTKVSDRERAYIDALAQRYSVDKNSKRPVLDRAYASAMAGVHERYPDDLDAATLYAESLMDLRPWNYWMPDGTPYPGTLEFIRVLETVLERNPQHPGANHLYVHAVEATEPRRAESAADRLRDLVPGAGHLQHMPSHIYVRVGRYADASTVNKKAIAADEDYIAQCRAQGIYPITYFPHNIHFLWFSSSWEGNSQRAIEAARDVAAKSTKHLDELPEWGQIFPVTPLYALVRFGKWDEILREPRPSENRMYWTGIWHYARGMAYVRKGEFPAAVKELNTLEKLAARDDVKDVVVGGNAAGKLLGVAALVLRGEMAAEKGEFDIALRDLSSAVLLEDSLNYIEPSDWYYPVRQSLGAVLLQAGQPEAAETIYWEDLRRNPDNGWSLYGLEQSLRAQGKKEQARIVKERFAAAWKNADVKLSASRF